MSMIYSNVDSKFCGKKFHYSYQEATLTLQNVLDVFQEFGTLVLYYIGRRDNKNGTYDIKAFFEYDKRIYIFKKSICNLGGQNYKCTQKKEIIQFIKNLDEYISNQETYENTVKSIQQNIKKQKQKIQKKNDSETNDLNEKLLKKTLLECHQEGLINILEMFKIQQTYLQQIQQKESKILQKETQIQQIDSEIQFA